MRCLRVVSPQPKPTKLLTLLIQLLTRRGKIAPLPFIAKLYLKELSLGFIKEGPPKRARGQNSFEFEINQS